MGCECAYFRHFLQRNSHRVLQNDVADDGEKLGALDGGEDVVEVVEDGGGGWQLFPRRRRSGCWRAGEQIGRSGAAGNKERGAGSGSFTSPW